MAALGGLLVLLALVSLIAVIKPFGPYKKRWHALIGFFVLVGLGGALAPSPAPSQLPAAENTPNSTTSDQTAPAEVHFAPRTSPAPPTPSSRWQYSARRDEMREASTHTACIDSTNELEFDFPYQGGSTATICFRQSPQYGFDAWINVDRGQFTCLMECRVNVRFDTGEVQTFSGGGASDGSANIVFFRNASRFLNATESASRIVVEAEFYQAGNHQMVFENAGGLDWPRD